MSDNATFAIGVGITATSHDIDTLDVLEISMASYNSDFMLLNQTTLVIGHEFEQRGYRTASKLDTNHHTYITKEYSHHDHISRP